MSDVAELYREVLLDHGRRPRNLRAPVRPSVSADGVNPICGDRVTVHVALDGERLADLCFEGVGCAVSQASASLMTESLRGLTRDEAGLLFEDFHAMLVGDAADASARAERLGELAIFLGLREYPTRVKCATLAWHSARAAIQQQTEPVSTE